MSGTKIAGVAGNDGTVFELVNNNNGTYTQRTLFAFNVNGSDGANPQGGLIADANGDLFGTTPNGGANGLGSIFELAHGSNTIITLASFNGSNGRNV